MLKKGKDGVWREQEDIKQLERCDYLFDKGSERCIDAEHRQLGRYFAGEKPSTVFKSWLFRDNPPTTNDSEK